MAFLYKRERDENELSYEVRAFLFAIGDGKSEAEAAAHACIDMEDLHRFKRDRVFRAAIRRARREGPRVPRFWSFDDLDDLGSSTGVPPPPGTPEHEIERQGWRRLG